MLKEEVSALSTKKNLIIKKTLQIWARIINALNKTKI